MAIIRMVTSEYKGRRNRTATLLIPIILFFIAGSDVWADRESALLTQATNFTGFVTLSNKQTLYVDHTKRGEDAPTLVVLNGLTYTTESWAEFVKELGDVDCNILRYDARGQGRTLIQNGMVMDDITLDQQVEDLRLLIEKMDVRGPVHILGLSYGGGLAAAFAAKYPTLVDKLILMAPYVGPIKTQDRWIRTEVHLARLMNPFLMVSDDWLYSFFLRDLVYRTYWVTEPQLLRHPYILEGVYRLANGIRKFTTGSVARLLPRGSVHLMIGLEDECIPTEEHREFWKELQEAQGSLLEIEEAPHKIPGREGVPRLAAGWVRRILDGDSRIGGGHTFRGNPYTGIILNETVRLNLPSERLCNRFLRMLSPHF